MNFSYLASLGKHGFLNTLLTGTYMLTDLLVNPALDYDCVGYYGNSCAPYPTPEWRHMSRFTWETNYNLIVTLGWRYISVRSGLVGLLVFFAVVNFLWSMVGALITPMILSWTSSDVLGAIISIAGVGMLTGSLIMSAWGGPKRRINGVLNFEMLSGV